MYGSMKVRSAVLGVWNAFAWLKFDRKEELYVFMAIWTSKDIHRQAVEIQLKIAS